MEELLEVVYGLRDDMSDMKNEMSDVKNNISNLNTRMSNMEVNVNQKLEQTKKEVLDNQFLFEQKYGEKIIAMYDIWVTKKDKEYENSKEIQRLDNRLTRAEADIFTQGEQIKVLEHNQ